jgi:hypothetical protein
VQRIVSRQACTSGMGDRTVVDPEAHLPYDMRTEAALLGVGLAGSWLRTEHVRLRRGVVYGRS